MEQQFELTNCTSFNPVHIFECGQCFRWNKELDGSYTGVFLNNVINVKAEKDKVIFRGICEGDIEQVCTNYFDLSRDYDTLKTKISLIDGTMKNSVLFGNGIRILHQDLWETLISFIISANNNIPRIKTTVERLCKSYGKKIVYNNKEFYTFPLPEELFQVTVQDFRKLGLGFRDIRLYETTQKVLSGEIDLQDLKNKEDTKFLKEELLKIPGVGPKVADCVMLFALQKFEVFPIDVWITRVMTEIYFENKETPKKEIQQLAFKKYGNLAGIAQQYLFYWRKAQ